MLSILINNNRNYKNSTKLIFALINIDLYLFKNNPYQMLSGNHCIVSIAKIDIIFLYYYHYIFIYQL